MNTKLLGRYSSVGASIVTALLLYGCDSGSSGDTGGAGGTGATSGPTTSGPTTTDSSSGTTDPSTTTTTGSGNPGAVELIDNMEDGDGSIINAGGRKGAWFTYNDASAGGKQTPAAMAPFTMSMLASASPSAGSKYGANTAGSGFTVWGAGVGVDLNNDGKTKSAYAATAYKGITFYAMVGPTADLGGKSVRFNLLDKNTAPEGGICDDSAMPAADKQCNDAFGADLMLTTSWQQFSFTWAQLSQQTWGLLVPSGIATDGLYSIQFKAGPMTSFDIWIDDLAFLQ